MGKKDVIDLYVYTHNEMLHYSAIKMKGILPLAATWKWLGGYAKWNKSDRESQILYDISVISENNKEADSQRINQCLPWGEVWGKKRFKGRNHYVWNKLQRFIVRGEYSQYLIITINGIQALTSVNHYIVHL